MKLGKNTYSVSLAHGQFSLSESDLQKSLVVSLPKPNRKLSILNLVLV